MNIKLQTALLMISSTILGLSIANLTIQPTTSHARPQPIQEVVTDEFQTVALPFLQKHCLQCHTGDEAENDLDLSIFSTQEQVNANLSVWEQVIEAIDDQYMPPSDETQPDAQETRSLKSWYIKTLVNTGQVQPTVPAMRRLNRTEYQNTICDLLRMSRRVFIDSSEIVLNRDYFEPATGNMAEHVLVMPYFNYLSKQPPVLKGLPEVPTDPPVEHGYSNNHQALSFSPLQAERYIELANLILNSNEFPYTSRLWDSLFVAPEIATTQPQFVESAKSRLAAFLPRAFRRPVTPQELQRYVDLFQDQIQQAPYTEAMKTTVTAILVSPSFLFRRDFSADSFDQQQVDSFALASRLSYFLWASMPDDALFQAAREGRLSNATGLRNEVRRMMKDKKIKSLATDFGMQWLQVSSVASARPDRKLYPSYYQFRLQPPGVAMMVEQLLLFETIMVENRNIDEFIQAEWTYVNRQLMDWYGLDVVKAIGFEHDTTITEDFFRVRWPNRHRGGAITSGATLLGTSATTRSSPVYRGAWVLDVIFNRPPPPPPADVPALEDVPQQGEQPLNVRDRLARHRQDINCAVCHDRIDSAGFALELFDAIGRTRKTYRDGNPVDTAGQLFGKPFVGAAKFKAAILKNERAFTQGFTEHMLKYALGRKLEITDQVEIETVVDKIIKDGKRFSTVVEEVVLSDLFRRPPVTPTGK